MKTGVKIAIIVPSVLVVGAITVVVIGLVNNSNRFKVSDTEWRENFTKILSDDRKFYTAMTSGGTEPELYVVGSKEAFNKRLGESKNEFKYKKNNKVYSWDADNKKWEESTDPMYSENKSLCGYSYLPGIEDSKSQFTFDDDKYTGTINKVKMIVKFTEKKVLENIKFVVTEDSSTVETTMKFNEIGTAELPGDFPTDEPTAI